MSNKRSSNGILDHKDCGKEKLVYIKLANIYIRATYW